MQLNRRGFLAAGAAAGVAGAAADVQAQEAVALTESQLGSMLAAMGLKVKQEKQRFDFQFKYKYEREDWVLSMSAVLSQNSESVWVMAWLDECPKSASEVPRTALLRLLSLNDRLGKGKFFAYIANNRRFILQRVVPNKGITTNGLKSTLTDLGGSVAESYAHWSVANWTSKPANSASAPSRAAAGPATENRN